MVKTSKPKAPLKKSPKLSGHEQVVEFMNKLDHPLKESIEAVREIILSTNNEITEHIKWNAPSFCYKGEDRVTFNIHKNEYILLVFHRGAKVKESKGKGRLFEDTTGLLEWLSDDRAVVKLFSSQDVDEKKEKLKQVVTQWIKLTTE